MCFYIYTYVHVIMSYVICKLNCVNSITEKTSEKKLVILKSLNS